MAANGIQQIGSDLIVNLTNVNGNSVGQTGKTMTVAIEEVSTGNWWDNATQAYDSATPVYNSMAEISATDNEGLYEYTLLGGAGSSNERYRITYLESGGSPNINFSITDYVQNLQITSTDIDSLRDAILLYKPLTDGSGTVDNLTKWKTTEGYQNTILEAICFGRAGFLSFKISDSSQDMSIALDNAHTASPDKRLFIGTGKDQGDGNFDIIGDDVAHIHLNSQ